MSAQLDLSSYFEGEKKTEDIDQMQSFIVSGNLPEVTSSSVQLKEDKLDDLDE